MEAVKKTGGKMKERTSILETAQSRRSFLKKSAVAGAAATVGAGLVAGLSALGQAKRAQKSTAAGSRRETQQF
jgi:ferric-dicitrate binding protein FerR (iron transport regulator)